ncbi:synaptonemal complex protein 2-like, partial [Leptodactylus fuscus]
ILVEKMNMTEYYLETLITDAFKGKGFQKISELFEDKVVCSSQRHSKALLNQLDRLINKELDRNEFIHVSLLLKCIQHFCKSECHEGWSLIQQGLVPKIILWFERTLEFLMICKDKSSTISALVDDFYDTALVICECNSENGVKQLLETFLFTLGFITMKKWPPHHVRLEAMKTFNFIIDKSSREEKKRLNSSEEMCTLMQGLARELFEVGDYDIQVTITEALCRMTTKKIRDNFAQKWFEDSFFAEAFKEINDKDFETDCRKFLNSFNSRIEDAVRVHTFPCLSVSTDVGELTKPQDEKLEHFWIDFNVGSQSISFYIQKNKGCHWEPVRLQKELLIGYSFEECNGQKFLSVHLKIPQSINNKLVKYIKMSFELEHDIQNATIKTYGEDLQMEGSKRLIQARSVSSIENGPVISDSDEQKSIQANLIGGSDSTCTFPSSFISEQPATTKVHHTSPQQTEKLNNLQDVMTDSRERVSSGDQEFTSFANDTPRVLEFPEEEKFPKISGKSSTSALSETKGNSPKQQSAEKSVDCSMELHCVTLAEYVKNLRIPRGLRMSVVPTIFKDDKDFCSQFELILNKCSFDIMTLTVTFLQKSITSLRAQIERTEAQLRTSTSETEFTTLKEKTEATLLQYRKDLQTQKRKKFLRDQEDYQNDRVYKWKEGYPQTKQDPRRRFTSPDSSDSSIGRNRSSYFTGVCCEGESIKSSDYTQQVFVILSSSERNTSNISSQLRTPYSQKTEAKKAVDHKDSSESEKSWILEYRREPSAKSADYSRKKRKSKLKVLPLSSQSSSEEKQHNKKLKGQPSKFTEIKIVPKQRGAAESLSFSELKLPGISGLLTPRHSHPQISGTLHLSDLDEDTMDPVQEMSSPEIIQFEKQPQTETGSKMDIESNKEQSEIFKGLYHSGISEDLKKRKRSSSVDEEEFILKPRKLFSSAKVSSDMEDGVFKADSRELGITECSFISSFESFTEDLKTKMMTRYKRMEVRAQDVLTASHQHVSSLMNRIQQSNFQKLDNFRKIVAHELSSLEAETEVLKELEKDTLDFWEAQTVKINEFCTNQKLRIEAMDRRINESLSVLQKLYSFMFNV